MDDMNKNILISKFIYELWKKQVEGKLLPKWEDLSMPTKYKILAFVSCRLYGVDVDKGDYPHIYTTEKEQIFVDNIINTIIMFKDEI